MGESEKEREQVRERECIFGVYPCVHCVCVLFMIINNDLDYCFPGTNKMGNHILNTSNHLL